MRAGSAARAPASEEARRTLGLHLAPVRQPRKRRAVHVEHLPAAAGKGALISQSQANRGCHTKSRCLLACGCPSFSCNTPCKCAHRQHEVQPGLNAARCSIPSPSPSPSDPIPSPQALSSTHIDTSPYLGKLGVRQVLLPARQVHHRPVAELCT